MAPKKAVKKPAKKSPKKAAPAKKTIKKASPAKKSAKKDKLKEKKPPSGYMLFCKQERPGIVKKNPKMAFGEVGKALGAKPGASSRTPRRPSTRSRPSTVYMTEERAALRDAAVREVCKGCVSGL